MIGNDAKRSNGDIPPSVGLLLLLLVCGGLYYSNHSMEFTAFANALDGFITLHCQFVLVVLVALALNLVWGVSVLCRVFGLSKQGSRLEAMAGKRYEKPTYSLKAFAISANVALMSLSILNGIQYPEPDLISKLFPEPLLQDKVLLALRFNFGALAFVVSLTIARISSWKFLSKFTGRNLPEMPRPENGVVIGSINEESEDEKPEWAVMPRRALNGNILITGSIGGGKTQGTILPYLDQVLTNFKPRPSILAIDPKGTFIPEALKIIKKHGLEEHVLHMKLGGGVTFNPIFNPTPLKEAHFLEIAQMIRAAAVNFMGKSFDSPFWEISAFNLIKNSLVFCGAKYYEV